MSKTREALIAAKEFAWGLQQGTDDGAIADQCLDLLTTLEAALAEPEQEPRINAVFETERKDVVGRRAAAIKRVEKQDDDSLTVVIDHWPQAFHEWQELSDEEKLAVCVAADNAMASDPNLAWRKALVDETSAALRAKNEVKG